MTGALHEPPAGGILYRKIAPSRAQSGKLKTASGRSLVPIKSLSGAEQGASCGRIGENAVPVWRWMSGAPEFANGARTAAFAWLFNAEAHNKVVVDSNAEAVEHYYEGDGEEAELGEKTKNALMTNEEQQARSAKIKSGKSAAKSGNYGVDITGDMYHVGRTTVQYQTTCSGNSCTTTYTGFTRNLETGGYGPDGFWDIFWGNDTMGPQGELGGTPYPYKPYEWSETYPNPYGH